MNRCFMTECNKELIKFNKKTKEYEESTSKLLNKLDKAKDAQLPKKVAKYEKKIQSKKTALPHTKAAKKILNCIEKARRVCAPQK